VEVHQSSAGSTDIVFGLGLSATIPDTNPPPTLRMPAEPPAYGYQFINAFGNLTFADPVAIHTPPGETTRLFVVEQDGRISVITNLAAPTRTVFLDIVSRVLGGVPTDERGLLGMAFHPGYSTNRRFFTFYTTTATTAQGANALHDRLSEWRASATNPAAADPASEVILFQQYDEANNHNAGDLHFGPDGYLYVSLGDEGDGNDTRQNSQRIDKDFFSGLMRLDVDNRPGSLMPNPHPANTNNPGGVINYRIPADNPWVGATSFNGVAVNPASVHTEFYAVGLRNPWRFSFDPGTGELYLADVGQNAYEEVDIIRRGGNYGWNYREALHAGPRGSPPAGVTFDNPIVEYAHGSATNQGFSITGGVVYRGNQLPGLNGAYLFADYVSGNVWTLRANGTNVVPFPQLLVDAGIAGFGVDPRNGDVLTCDQSEDTIKRLVIDTNSIVGGLPPTLADTGAFTNFTTLTNQTEALTANAGVIPYDINVAFWSDGADKTRWFFMPTNGAKIGFAPEGNWSLPAGMAWVKHFDLELTNGEPASARRLETRILVRNSNGMYGVTYRGGDSLTNATLVPAEGMDEPFVVRDAGGLLRTQVWHYPGRAECLACHTPVGGWALGFNTVQMNRDVGSSNQIAALSAAGYFSSAVSNIHSLRALSPAADETVSREWRVRSYLAANCAQCHQPGGSGLGTWSASITNFTVNAGLIQGALINNGGNTNARVIAPGSISNSMLLSRISIRGPGQMPPLASTVVDQKAVALLSAWITNDLAAGWTNAIEPFWIAARSTNGVAAIEFTQPANRAHRVETATNLAPPVAWQFLDVPENRPWYPAVSNAVTVTDPATNAGQKFYRVRLSTP
jgi:glucose/arabinose dehydrogenase/mono/diheme cytochrome c family protein